MVDMPILAGERSNLPEETRLTLVTTICNPVLFVSSWSAIVLVFTAFPEQRGVSRQVGAVLIFERGR